MQKPLPFITTAILAILAVFCQGCATSKAYEYCVVWENHSGLKLSKVRISYGNFSTTYGWYLRATEPLTSEVKVEFSTPNGEHLVRQVQISEDIRRNICRSHLVFFIKPDLSVSVCLVTEKEWKAIVASSGPETKASKGSGVFEHFYKEQK